MYLCAHCGIIIKVEVNFMSGKKEPASKYWCSNDVYCSPQCSLIKYEEKNHGSTSYIAQTQKEKEEEVS